MTFSLLFFLGILPVMMKKSEMIEFEKKDIHRSILRSFFSIIVFGLLIYSFSLESSFMFLGFSFAYFSFFIKWK